MSVTKQLMDTIDSHSIFFPKFPTSYFFPFSLGHYRYYRCGVTLLIFLILNDF